MEKGSIFWLIMIIWILFGFFVRRVEFKEGNYTLIGHDLLAFVLFFLLGWAVFGFMIK